MISKEGPGPLDYFFLNNVVNVESEKKLLNQEDCIQFYSVPIIQTEDSREGWNGLKLKAVSKACNNNTIDWW